MPPGHEAAPSAMKFRAKMQAYSSDAYPQVPQLLSTG